MEVGRNLANGSISRLVRQRRAPLRSLSIKNGGGMEGG